MGQVVEDLEALVTPFFEKESVELVDISYQKEHGGWVLRLAIDKPGGVTLDDCESWSRKIGQVLDEREIIDRSYALEVSSPGLDRPLKKLKHFKRFLGERVSVKLYAPLDGQKVFHGTLLDADEKTLTLRLANDRDVTLPFDQVAKSALDPIIDF